MTNLPQPSPPRQGVVPFPVPRRTETVARETLFGPTGNEGLAAQLFDLCQSNDPRAWEQAQAVVMEMAEVLTVTHREFIRRTAAAQERHA